MSVFRAIAIALILLVGVAHSNCLGYAPIVFDDMHDGDQKVVTETQSAVRINPYNNDQTWTVTGSFDSNCAGSFDFDVPGKPDYPPVNITATVWLQSRIAGTGSKKLMIEWTDPSGTIAPAGAPINTWIQNNK